ncbi:MAG: hypothetical protein JNL56_01205 [Alphaproteobacteria bacterium]|jgi:hypothetical protein|nr:hypothetical protein [Alphaproteobacteria bacterium]
MNAHTRDGVFDDIALRILRAVEELRAAIADGSAADPAAARELADRMERYAASVVSPAPSAETAGN